MVLKDLSMMEEGAPVARREAEMVPLEMDLKLAAAVAGILQALEEREEKAGTLRGEEGEELEVQSEDRGEQAVTATVP